MHPDHFEERLFVLRVARERPGGFGDPRAGQAAVGGADQADALACRPAVTREVARYVVGAADGVPFLVEELLAAPGVPASFAAAVAARLAGLDEAELRVIQVAAVLGRQFDWRLLTTSADGPAGGGAGARARRR